MAKWAFKFDDDGLLKKLNALERKAKPIINKASREVMKPVRKEIAEAMPVDSGDLKKAMKKAKIRNLKGRGKAGVGILMPTRAELDIPADAKFYYPIAIEYGTSKQPPQKPIRGTVNRMSKETFAKMARAIAAGIRKITK